MNGVGDGRRVIMRGHRKFGTVLKRLFVMFLFSRVGWKGDRAVKRESFLGRESKAKG